MQGTSFVCSGVQEGLAYQQHSMREDLQAGRSSADSNSDQLQQPTVMLNHSSPHHQMTNLPKQQMASSAKAASGGSLGAPELRESGVYPDSVRSSLERHLAPPRQGTKGTEISSHSSIIVANNAGQGKLAEVDQVVSSVLNTPRMGIGRPQGLEAFHLLTHKGAPIGERQSSGEGTDVPLDSTSPVVMTNLARKVLFIDGKTSMAHSKTGLSQRKKSVGLDMDPEDGR